MENPMDGAKDYENRLSREQLLADLKAVARNAEELLKGTAGEVGEKANEVRARLTAALERARASCHDLQEQAAQQAQTSAKTADSFIRERPYEALGIAFGLGLLVSLILGRKNPL